MKPSIAALAIALLLRVSAFALPDHPIEHQLVTVQVSYQAWNEYRPWQKSKPARRTFLGTVVSKNRILVPAAYLQDATLIQLEKFDNPPRVPAQIVHCDQQVGLAVLTTDEAGFFDDLNPVEMADSAEGDNYYCAAWKSNQLNLSSCRWSQVKTFKSSIPYFGYAGITFITDLKNGGRGEPVFSGDRMIGMTRSQSKDLITVIPVDLIKAYLHAIDLPAYPGFGRLGIDYQYNTGQAQAAYYGQKGKPSGVRIQGCFPGGSADGILQPEDILLELDGHAIDAEGDYRHPRYGMMSLKLIATEGHYAGDVLPARVLRDKKEIELEIPLKNIPASAALIPLARPDLPPPYLVAGGLVFRELDDPYLQAWGDDWQNKIPASLRILRSLKGESPTPHQQRLIVLADVFPDEYNLGYHEMAQNIVKTVNGLPIDSIEKLETAFHQPQNGFHVIEFMPSYGTCKVILDADSFETATATILENYQIPSRIRLSP
ncbi:PDZ domain-containing protein [Pontiella sp.]|uniref:PDZ domain-containing protein n=1 Tax=Pontiella sp. TaxID=2837462 RepID=UPI0035691ED0